VDGKERTVVRIECWATKDLFECTEQCRENDEIYNMLKPKLDNDDILQYEYYYDEIIKSIALAYRSGYLRAKEGRSFKIGGEKE
jgi:hypothetical protein